MLFKKSYVIVNKYNNTYHTTTKMKLTDVKPNTYVDSSKENNDKNPKFKIGDTVRISKYKNILAKAYTPNWSETIGLWLKKLKMLRRGHMLLIILMRKKLL